MKSHSPVKSHLHQFTKSDASVYVLARHTQRATVHTVICAPTIRRTRAAGGGGGEGGGGGGRQEWRRGGRRRLRGRRGRCGGGEGGGGGWRAVGAAARARAARVGAGVAWQQCSSVLISAHQCSSDLIRSHQCSSGGLISAHQCSTVFIKRAHQGIAACCPLRRRSARSHSAASPSCLGESPRPCV